ncbi:LEPR-XLL domain-containing protein, partial [Pseudomonas gingeri]|uniref:LEPR-XLL domain-containing protein n=1 Tax=Pseudomonas gingeri TaxID=117681 RepID=UPI0015A01187|nr:LEPR-XLL domain-containing protein [Pseudomonas gingeri]
MWWSKPKARSQSLRSLVSPMIIPLEPRMLFDGAVAATVAEAAQPANHPTA